LQLCRRDTKLQGLAESSDGRVAGIGQEMEGLMKTLEKAIYAARVEPPPEGLPILYAAQVDRLKRLCTAHWSDAHSALRSVAREFLYDWEVIMRPLAEPHLPLSNNAAEQALRHWVIARNISHGTHSEAGTRAFALLASVIETCNRRGASSWRYLSRHRHPCGSQGPGASPASPYPGSRVKTEGV
jgi:transposase